MNPGKQLEQLLGGALEKRKAKDFGGAAALLEEALCAAPGHPRILFLLGTVRLELGDRGKAQSALEQAVSAAPDMAEPRFMLGRLYWNEGDLERAAEQFYQVKKLRPDDGMLLLCLGTLERERNNLPEAVALLEAAIAAAPGPEPHYQLGIVHELAGNDDAAIDCYLEAARKRPRHPDTHARLSKLAGRRHLTDTALRHAVLWAEQAPEDPAAHMALGRLNLTAGHYDESRASYQSAGRCDPGLWMSSVGQAEALQRMGRAEAAYSILEPLFETHDRAPEVALVFADVSPKLGREAEAIDMIERLLADVADLPESQLELLHRKAGDLYDRMGEYDAAFSHYRSGNEQGADIFDPEAHEAQVDALIATFDKATVQRLPRPTRRFEQPVFIVGMPRSGTSLTEQIIATHPQAKGAGELNEIGQMTANVADQVGAGPYPGCVTALTESDLDRMAEFYVKALNRHVGAGVPDGSGDDAGNAIRITDKMPSNYEHLGLIGAMFPGVLVIHTRREPLDTCLSCYTQGFSSSALSFTNNLTHLGFYYRQYERLMAHWRKVLDISLLEMSYEELVAGQETMSRKIIDHVGLPWDDVCLNFHENVRMIGTASYEQVKRPMYKTSVARWKHYEKHLGPLIDALADTA